MEKNSSNSFVLNALATFECRLTRYATRLAAGDLDVARDAVQQTFLKLCQNDPHSLKDKLAPWLFTVCRNCVIDVQRRSSRQFHMESNHLDQLIGPDIDPAEISEQSDLMLLLQSLIDRLPASEREVIDLWSQNFSHQEIAEITDRNQGAVRVQLHRAVKRLKLDSAVAEYLSDSLKC